MSSRTRQHLLVGVIVAVSLLMATGYYAKVCRKGTEYIYQEGLDGYVHYIHGKGMAYRGQLDKAGNFIPQDTGTNYLGFYSGIPLNRVNTPRPRGEGIVDNTEVVYEFRSGYLILGKLNCAGDFIPAEGSRVIRFSDYRYSPDAPRIYNLPGRFVEKPADDGGN
jgi:hypothetical protein